MFSFPLKIPATICSYYDYAAVHILMTTLADIVRLQKLF